MRCLIATSLLFLLPSLSGAEIVVEQDQSLGRTLIKATAGPMQTYGAPQFTLAGVVPTSAQDKGEFALMIAVQFEAWHYTHCHELSWVVDDKPFSLPAPLYKGAVVLGSPSV